MFSSGSLRCAELLPQGINLKILGVIPARGGSKSIPRKNLSDVHGRPLLSFIVEAAKNTRTLDRVILTTEDEEIAAVGRKWGAETPFMQGRVRRAWGTAPPRPVRPRGRLGTSGRLHGGGDVTVRRDPVLCQNSALLK